MDAGSSLNAENRTDTTATHNSDTTTGLGTSMPGDTTSVAQDSGSSGGAVDASSQGTTPSTPVQTSCTAGAAFTLRLTTVATVNAPMFIVGDPREPETLFILERGGAVRVVTKGMLRPQPLFTVAPVAQDGERGALSMALHPAFPENGRMFVFFTAPASTVEEWKRTENGATKAKVLYSFAHSQMFHQGGQIAFGPDLSMYVSIGDNQNSGNAPNITARYGKILRISPETGMPQPGNMMNSFTWNYGLRNPYRFSFDRVTGDMYIADVGENTMEEIDFQPRGSPGQNFGWPAAEGTMGNSGTKPIYAYGRGVGQAIIGGYVYRGKRFPCLTGRYFYGDNRSGTVRSFIVANDVATSHMDHSAAIGGAGISSFGEDGNGEIYITRLNGRVARIEAQ